VGYGEAPTQSRTHAGASVADIVGRFRGPRHQMKRRSRLGLSLMIASADMAPEGLDDAR
jgi:hypothetical protein